jgi:ATP-dependent Clp protease ATP-binding subunit ClpA
MSERSIGFIGDSKGKEQKAIKNMFSPEFRNRLDATITFAPLSPETVEQVVDKMVGELQQQLVDKKVEITLSPAARSWLAKEGYEPAFGARPLRRMIMKEIGDVLTEEILFGNLTKGGKVKIGRKNNKTTFSYL